MATYLLRFGLALVGLAAPFCTPAHAASISGTYYEDTASMDCPNSTQCFLVFPTLADSTAGSVITITEVSCTLDVTAGVGRGQAVVTDNGANVRRPHFMNVVREPGGTSFRDTMNLRIGGGPPRQLRLLFKALNVTTKFEGTCTFVGTISAN